MSFADNLRQTSQDHQNTDPMALQISGNLDYMIHYFTQGCSQAAAEGKRSFEDFAKTDFYDSPVPARFFDGPFPKKVKDIPAGCNTFYNYEFCTRLADRLDAALHGPSYGFRSVSVKIVRSSCRSTGLFGPKFYEIEISVSW